MLLIIFLLFFFAVAVIVYDRMPQVMSKYSGMQQKRMEETVKTVDRFLVVKEGKKMLFLYTTAPLLLAAIGFIFTKTMIGLGIGLVIGFIIPKIVIRQMEQIRRNRFQGQLVDGLMVLSSALKSGMSFNQAIEILVEEVPAPLSEEFALVLRENHMGVPFEECLLHLKRRMPLDDLGLIIAAIGVARETGGDLTEIFSQLVFTIREKNKLERKVKTLTVQGRLQGIIMGLLPIAFAVFIYYVNPENFNILINTETGRMLLVYSIVSEAIGLVLIKKLSRVEV